MITTTVNGVEVEIEIQILGSSQVQNINGAMETHLVIHPVIISPRGPGGPGGGEPLPLPRAA